MTSPQKTQNADTLSLATRYSLLRGRHLSMEKYWNERHSNDRQHIERLQHRNSSLLKMLQIAQSEINNLQKTVNRLQSLPSSIDSTHSQTDLHLNALHPNRSEPTKSSKSSKSSKSISSLSSSSSSSSST